MTIPTPEGVEVEVTLAGIGSRFIAALIDQLIKMVIIIALIIAVFGIAGLSADFEVGTGSGFLAVALVIILIFLITFAYDVLFETLAGGRTPGKKWTGLRVVKVGGSPVGFLSSAIRNLMRIIDLLPTAYGIGMISIGVTKLNQRVGDLAAGTIVVRERLAAAPPSVPATFASPAPLEGLGSWDVSAVTSQDLVTVRRFLERRHHLAPGARAHLADDLARRLRPKVAGAPDLSPESFLEQISLAKAQRA